MISLALLLGLLGIVPAASGLLFMLGHKRLPRMVAVISSSSAVVGVGQHGLDDQAGHHDDDRPEQRVPEGVDVEVQTPKGKRCYVVTRLLTIHDLIEAGNGDNGQAK